MVIQVLNSKLRITFQNLYDQQVSSFYCFEPFGIYHLLGLFIQIHIITNFLHTDPQQ